VDPKSVLIYKGNAVLLSKIVPAKTLSKTEFNPLHNGVAEIIKVTPMEEKKLFIEITSKEPTTIIVEGISLIV
jgi:3-dehydroquinate synthetase